MSMAVHLSEFPGLKVRMPFEHSSIEKRWRPDEARAFAEQVRAFAEESDFGRFVTEQRPVYQLAETRMRRLIDERVDVAWFERFFGARPRSRFVVAPGLLSGHWNYAASFAAPGRPEELYAVIGAWVTDDEGMPVFDGRMTSTIVHEFNHSFVNHVVARHERALATAGAGLYELVAQQMKAQGYSNWKTMIDESLVRAAVARYTQAHGGPNAALAEVELQRAKSFLWTDEVFALLGVYENSRRRYPTFEAFFPHVVAYFGDLASRKDAVAARLEGMRPRVVWMNPANGSEGVDPGLAEIVIVFDRPMNRGSHALVTVDKRQDKFPELQTPGKFWSYDETGHVFTFKVRLKPEWSYEFQLNTESFPGFQSKEGIPLKPYPVHFRTGPAR